MTNYIRLIYLSKEDQNQFKYNKGDTEGFVNYPLSIKDIVFSTFIREDEDYIKISFRSQEILPATNLLRFFSTVEGHRNASGGGILRHIARCSRYFENGLQQYVKTAILKEINRLGFGSGIYFKNR
jgi:phosphoesterase RecJ-like protein